MLVVAAFLAAVGAPIASRAQTLAPGERPSERPLEPGAPQRALPPALAPTPLPPPPAAEPGRLSSGPRVLVRAFAVTGSTVFSEEALAAALAPWTGRELSSEDLLAARDAVTLLYVRNGYVNSGAVVPDQRIADGVVALQVVEGRLGAIEIDGNRWFRSGWLASRIAHGIDAPLDAKRLGERLDVMQRDPRFAHLNAELVPGARPGEALLRVRIEEEPPWHLSFESDNHVAPSIGPYEGRIEGAFDNLAGRGDTLAASFDGSAGLLDGDVSYRIPVSPWDTELWLEYRNSASDVVEHPFQDLGVHGRTQTYTIGVEQPVWRSRRVTASLSISAEHRRGDTELFDQPFSFTPGLAGGRTRITPLRLAQELIFRDETQVFAARSTFSVGLHASDLDESEPGAPQAHWFAWLGQLQYVRRFDALRGSELVLRGDAQLTPDTLFPIEQYSLGGAETVRGYRENQLVRDAGMLAAIEMRVPLLRIDRDRVVVQIAPFFDTGRSWWARDGIDEQDRWLASAGVGLRASYAHRLSAEIYWGSRLQHVVEPADWDLQDAGVHFRVTTRVF